MDPTTTTRPPTPGDLAAKLRQQAARAAAAPRPAPVLGPAPLRPAPAAAARRGALAVVREGLAELTPAHRIVWDRAAYERALRRSHLHPHARLLALVLASLAVPDTGRIPRRLTPSVAQLADACGLHTRQIHSSLQHLQARGWIQRPTHPNVKDFRARRAMALTLPPTD